MRIRFAALLLVVVCIPPPSAAQNKLEIRQVAGGVYAALQPNEQRIDDCNSTIVVTNDYVLVVDTQVSPRGPRALIAEIRKLTPKPVRYVVYTHWHSDHVQGSAAYREAFPGVQFIAHRNAREDVEKRAIPDLKQELENTPKQIEAAEQQLASGKRRDGQPFTEEQKQQIAGRIQRRKAHLADIREAKEIVVPDVTFEDSLTLYDGDREIRLLRFPGHTRGDVVIFLPKERVLITGDLLDDLPFTGHGSPASLVGTLKTLDTLSWDIMIPGHGAVRQGHDHLRKVQELFDSIVTQVAAAAREKLSQEDTVKNVDVDKFRDYFVHGDEVAARYWNFFMVEAAQRAYQEATGTVKAPER